MDRRMFLIGFLAVGLSTSGCSAGRSVPDYRYKLTLKIGTPEGSVKGFSVIQVNSHLASHQAMIPGKLTTKITGQAVSIRLPNGRYLFALLTKPDSPEGAEEYALDAFSPPIRGNEQYISAVDDINSRIGQQVALPRKDYPMLVTFSNISDKNTVKAVDPDNLQSIFGAGYHLDGITIEITDDEPTKGAEQILPWLPNLQTRLVDDIGFNLHYDAPEKDLTVNNFIRKGYF